MNKKVLNNSFLIIAIASIFFACNKEKLNDITIDLKSEFEESAKLHNEAMDYILNSLKNKKGVDSELLFQKVERLSNEFIQANINSFNKLKNPSKTMVDECNRLLLFRKSTSSNEDYLPYTIDKYNNYLTERQKGLLYKINDIVYSKNSVDVVVEKLKYVKDVDCLELWTEERNVIYAATTIGIESAIYWNKHLNEWIAVVTNESTAKSLKSTKGWFEWSSISKSDISGAIGGAIGGALVGAAVGGVGAGPGAIAGFVGGGIGASSVDAVAQCLDNWF